jgi:hypothetical protein
MTGGLELEGFAYPVSWYDQGTRRLAAVTGGSEDQSKMTKSTIGTRDRGT